MATRTEIQHFSCRSLNTEARVHLRTDPDGSGTLIVNANSIFHLNATAAILAGAILRGEKDEIIARSLRLGFRLAPKQAVQEVREFREQLDQLLMPNGPCPVHEMGLETKMPFAVRPSAPYRMDLALTYRCNNDCPHCYNARPRNYPEMATAAWKQALDRLWALGVPHIVFTGGEPTLRSDLPDLIAHAESLGQITGVNTNGRRLAKQEYLDKLVAARLDHIQITVECSDGQLHNQMVGNSRAYTQTIEGLKNALASKLFVMTNTTMLRTNYLHIDSTLDQLAELGVPTIGLNALIYSGKGAKVGTGLTATELAPILEMARRKTTERGQRLIWYTPTEYCEFDPIDANLGAKACTAALHNMCVEPNGDVLPCQSFYTPVGNLLADPWEKIWRSSLCEDLRERRLIHEKCRNCAALSTCGGGCPLQSSAAIARAEVTC